MKPRAKAEALECLRDALFSTEVTWKNQNYTSKIFSEEYKTRTIISTECFFKFSGLFLEFKRIIAIFNGGIKKDRQTEMKVEIII